MPASSDAGPAGDIDDESDLTRRARAYGEAVVSRDRWPLSAVDISKVTWARSTRMRRRNGVCDYGEGGRCTVSIGAHVYERGGFEACREIIRHELVHVWQHQHAGEVVLVADGVPRLRTDADDGIRVEPGHGPSFRAWVDPLDLEGRCSRPYRRHRADYDYVFECPDCGEWWGRHRLCTSVRQAACGRFGTDGYRYCADCETLVYLRAAGRYLAHADYDDAAIRAFADGDGDDEGLLTIAVEEFVAIESVSEG